MSIKIPNKITHITDTYIFFILKKYRFHATIFYRREVDIIKENKGKVHLPKLFAILGTSCFLIFIIPAFITLFSEEPLWLPILFFVFAALGLILIIGFINCRISYDDKGFTAKNFFGIKRYFTYDQVTAIKENIHEAYIYMGKKRVMVDRFSIGGINFILFLHKKYRTFHNGKTIPRIENDKKDIFNGNVYDTSGFLAAYIALSLFVVGFAVLMAFYVFAPSVPENTVKQEVVFTSFEYDGDIKLTSSDNITYRTDYWNESHDPSDIASVCDGKTTVTVYSDEVTPKYEEHYYRIKALCYNDKYLITFEETNGLWVKNNRWALLFPAICAIIIGSIIIGSIIVGRNPQKFSKNVVRIFFKDGYVKY